MRILVTNDDGIDAPGLAAPVAALRRLAHEVVVVAPDGNRSGTGHAITYGVPVTVRRHRMAAAPAFAVAGTPADCIRVAPRFWGAPPDLVVSGINRGANLGPDIHRSGTVGAAREAALMGLPALALSAVHEFAAVPDLARRLPTLIDLALSFPGSLLNVNLPDARAASWVMVPAADTLGAHQRTVREVGRDTWEVDVWRGPAESAAGDDTLTDLEAVRSGLIAITVVPVLSRARTPQHQTTVRGVETLAGPI